jgi:hypothetical protein
MTQIAIVDYRLSISAWQMTKTNSVVDESSMKSKYFSHWPASLLEGPFGPHKIVIPKFWTYDSDEDT